MDSTLLKGLEILERVVGANGSVSVSSLARELKRPKSNVHRTLSTLRMAGYLLYDPESRRYYPSLRLAQMGQRVSATFPFRSAVRPALERLSALTGESAHFAYLDGDNIVFLVSVLPSADVASVIPDNTTLRWDDTAFGFAVASALPQQTADTMLAGVEHSSAAGRGLTAARSDGIAVTMSHGERRNFEIAAPLRSEWGSVIGGLGITGPAVRLSQDVLPALIRAVRDVAADTFAETDRGIRMDGRQQQTETP